MCAHGCARSVHVTCGDAVHDRAMLWKVMTFNGQGTVSGTLAAMQQATDSARAHLSRVSLRKNLFPNASSTAGALFTPIDGRREAQAASDVLDRFDVRPRDWAALIDWLSGGNQQKVFVGRWLATGAQLFIMEEPTAGVDVGAKGVIHRILRDLAAEGAGVRISKRS
jgi:ABC-type sugar transport system ATPase subunit